MTLYYASWAFRDADDQRAKLAAAQNDMRDLGATKAEIAAGVVESRELDGLGLHRMLLVHIDSAVDLL